MLLQKQDLRCMNAVAHEGKLVIIATDSSGCLWYTVKQDGYESGYLSLDPASRTGWETFASLDMADENDDPSVVAREAATLTREDVPGTFLLKSRYKSKTLGAVAPVQLVSADGHIYVFRQSKESTLLCDRFVLDGLTNKLGRKLEVRFKRSRKRYEPFNPGKSAEFADTLDFRDANGAFFYEPTIELCLVNGLADGWFAVARVGTAEHEEYRWHVFSYNATSKKIEALSIRASEDGLFDVRDHLVFDEAPSGGNGPIPRSIPGILKRSITVPQAVITGGPAATKYDLQQEREVATGSTKQLVRTKTRLMLAVPTDRGLAAYSFEVAADGTLAEVVQSTSALVVRSDERDLMLPLDTLDDIKLVGTAVPPPQGVITGTRLGVDTDDVSGKIIVTSPESGTLSAGDMVQIRGTKHYNGLFTVVGKTDESFIVEAQFVDNEMGVWEKREAEETGLMFDGMVTAFEKTSDGKLKVFAQNHGLITGDAVQIIGTTHLDGEHPVTRVNSETFVIDRRWTAGEAVNVKLLSSKRRGIVLDGLNDCIDLPPDAFPSGQQVTICVWARGGDTLPKDATFLEALDQGNRRVAYICLPASAGGVYFDSGNGTDGVDRVGAVADAVDYKGRWTHWAFTKDTASGKVQIYRNGVSWSSGDGTRPLGQAAKLRIGAMVNGSPPGNRQYYEGTLADLAIYNRALSPEEIRNSIYMTLTGNETGLMGYWRLGAVVEAEVRTVTDISTYGRDGTVFGSASCGGISLSRKLADGTTLVARYTNDELVAVTQRATYVEEFDFRILSGGVPLTKAALENTGLGKPVFVFRHWGKRSRNAEDIILIDPPPQPQPFVDLGGGWFRASCRLTIPDGMALLRSFEIADVRGTWDKIEINRHAIRIISDAITMSTGTESHVLATLSDAGAPMAAKLEQIAASELVEAQKLAEKLAVEAKLTLLADAEYLRAERDSVAKEVETLTAEAAALEAQYKAADADPFNHYCAIKITGSTNQYLHFEASGYLVIWDVPHQFEFVPMGNGRLGIKLRGENRYVYRDGQGRLAHGNGNTTTWMSTPGNGCMYVMDPNDGRFWHREGGTGKMIVYSTGQAWTLIPGEPCNTSIPNAKAAWEAKQKQLAERQTRLSELNTLLDPNTPQRPTLEQRLTTLATELGTLQSTLATANTAYLEGVKSLQQGALSMPVLGTDPRGLDTTGAILGFVVPSSRISMLETCEGNVLITYQDAANRMRMTHYDATSDSRNTAYEQWVTDAGHVCLNQTKLGTAVSLAKPVPMENTWSVEAWVLTPVPSWEWTVLAGTQDQKNAPLVVLGGVYLGLRSEGVFFASGFKLDTLPQGWHHVAAVKRVEGKNTSVIFYVDGLKVGSAVTPSYSAVSLNGTSHGVELQVASLPQGAEVTVSFWAKAGARVNPAAAAVALEATDAQNKRVLRISLPNSAGRIVWDCGSDAAALDSLECTAQASDYEGAWTHWAFTKNATTGLMRIYRNGRLWARGIGKSKPITAATKVTVGRATSADPLGFRGEIADLCVWNKELSAAEIQNGLGRPIPVEDTRLAGFWKFEGTADKAKAKDYSKAAKDGTLVGAPVILEVAPPNQIALEKVGQATTTIAPPPPPSPIRGGSRMLYFDCNDDKVELPAQALPQGNAITIAFWTRAGANMPRQSSLLEAINPSFAFRIMGVHLPWNPEVVYFDCGGDAAGGDRIEKPITAAEYKNIWVHWAFTKNCATGEMKIYRNGVLWQSGTGKTKPIPAATRFMVGCSVNVATQQYHGWLRELSVWNKALTQAEINQVMNNMLRGDEPGLHGYWAFDTTQATDLSAGKRHGTYFGSPAVSPPVPEEQAVYLNGNGSHVVVPEMNVDFSQGLTIEAWVQYNAYANNARILDFGVGQGADNIVLWNSGTTSTLGFSIFRGGTAQTLNASNVLETGNWIHLAATLDAAGNAKIYKNGTLVASGTIHTPANLSRKQNYLGKSNWTSDGFFNGKMAEVRLWNKARTQSEIQSLLALRLSGQESGLVGYWTFSGANAPDLTAAARHGTYTGGATADMVSGPSLGLPPPLSAAPFTPLPPLTPPLKLSELRLWSTALSDDEIAVNSKTLLSGNEPNLIAYLPMNEAIGSEVRDVTGGGRSGTVDPAVAVRWACAAPIGDLGGKRDGVIALEYSSVIFDPAAGRKVSIMRRFFASAANDNILVLPEKRIEELDLIWIGNAQFAPTLLGYIEGAPPVPSENLTEDFSYNGATSVELAVSEDLEFRWNQSEDIGAGVSLDLFWGMDQEVEGGPLVAMATVGKGRAGYKGALNMGWGWQRETSITTRSSKRLTDRLELRGTPEQTPKFPHIGKRFIPKNVGYALVVSATADLFVSKLRRSGKMIGYQMTPVEGLPPDVNTITFLMNPAYVMAGSLDGLTGSRATSDRFHRHVPAMRAQYGSLYPASYYRLKEAYALKQAIENEDKRREAFFAQFSTEDAGFKMNSQLDDASVSQPVVAGQGNVAPDGGQEQSVNEQTEEVKKRHSMIQSTIGDPSHRAHADSSFNAWQTKMERLQALAGKRNIVNTYVWDADGGLRTETQSFAHTAEHTIGGSFTVDGGLGGDLMANAGGLQAELTVLVNGSLTQTASKSKSTTTGIELNVDLSGVEATGITNHDDMPILPGEKVDRYRFMTFYLENSTKNFHDFWSYVVDPEWLQSNGEEARALRQAMGKANKTWRVLHRVTYVERPALMGFGRDIRAEDSSSGDVMKDYLVTLTENQLSLQDQLDEIKQMLTAVQAKLNNP